MSLDYKLSGIENHNAVCYEERNDDIVMRQITRQLIFFTERIGCPTITKENYVEVWRRINAWERVNSEVMYYPDEEDGKPRGRYITLQEVASHAGLRTNSRRLTAAKFEDEILKRLACDVNELLVQEQRQCETLPTTKATQPAQ